MSEDRYHFRTLLSSQRQVLTIEEETEFWVRRNGKPNMVPNESGVFETWEPVSGPYPLDDPRFSPPRERDTP